MSRKFTVFITVITLSMLLIKPGEMLAEAGNALLLWFNVVLPALFPFMAGMEILMRYGAANLLGRIFEPLMRPVFNVPGCAALAFIGGALSGYPLGAKITGELLQKEKLTPEEGQRVMSFCNNPGPFFLLGAVAAGMLGSPGAGYLLIAAIFAAAVTTGILFRSCGGGKAGRARTEYHTEYPENGVFPMLREVISSCADALVRVGGFMVMFSVIAGGAELLARDFIPEAWNLGAVSGVLRGLLEMTGGAGTIAGADMSFGLKLGIIAAMTAFGGLSVHGQSLSMPGMEKLRGGVYVVSKAVNGLFAFLYTFLLWSLLPEGAVVAAARAGSAGSAASLKSAAAFLGLTLLYVLCVQRSRPRRQYKP